MTHSFFRAPLFLALAVALGACDDRPPSLTGSGPRLLAEAPSSRPNVIVIQVDDQALGEEAHMPHLQRLVAAEGTTFSRFFVTSPLCCPSRASILLGQYAHNHRIVGNAAPAGGWTVFRDLGHESRTLAVALSAAGYRTAMLGKYLNHYGAEVVPPGWTRWFGVKPQNVSYHDYTVIDDGDRRRVGRAHGQYMTDVLAAEAVSTIRKWTNDGRPFFMLLAPFAPHNPAEPAPRHVGRFSGVRIPRTATFNEADLSDKPSSRQQFPLLTPTEVAALDAQYQRRLESLLAVDEMIESIVSLLKERGVLDETYIFFVSDNGYHLGHHRVPQGKGQPFDEDIRVPFIVRGPGVARGARVDRLAANIDIAPTIAEITGASLVAAPDGRSLLPLMRGYPVPSWRRGLLAEMMSAGSGAEEESGGESVPNAYWSVLRTPDWAYVEWANGGRELYSTRDDSIQADNSYMTADAGLVASLSRSLATLRTCAGAACRQAEDAVDPQAAASDTTIVIVGGVTRRGTTGAPVAEVRAAVRAPSGRFLDSIPVTFTASGTGDAVPAAPATRGSQGVAGRWTLGCEVGTQYLRVSAPGLRPRTVTATAVAGPGSPRYIRVIPTLDSVPVQSRRTVTVMVTDVCGRPSPGVDVRWNGAGPNFVDQVTRTDGEGMTSVSWTVGTVADGEAEQLAVAISADDIVVPTRVLPGPTARLRIVQGGQQRAPAGGVLPATIVVAGEDDWGNTARNAEVRWVTSTGTPGLERVIASAAGLALNTWRLGGTPGEQVITVTSGHAPPLTITATATAAVASAAADSGDAQAGPARTPLPRQLVVLVRDAQGRPVRNAVVSWTTVNGFIVATSAVTDGTGRARATWTPYAAAAAATAVAQVDGDRRVTFTAGVGPVTP